MKNYLFILGILSFSSLTFAEGGMASGGGDVVVCQSQGSLPTVELLDFYEGENVFGDELNNLRNSKLSTDEILEIVLKRMDRTAYGYLSTLTKLSGFKRKTLRDMVKHVQEKKKIIKNYIKLKPINDSFEEFDPPAHCEIIQAASFRTEDLILINKDIWDLFSEFDRAGLIFHEAVYWYHRLLTEQYDSRRSRRIVAKVFSDLWEMEDVAKDLPETITYCETFKSMQSDVDTWQGTTTFIIKPHPVYKTMNEMRFLILNGDMQLSKKSALIANNFPFLDRDREDDVHYGTTLMTDSLYENSDRIDLSSHPVKPSDFSKPLKSKVYIKANKYSYPERKSEKSQLMSCHTAKNWMK